MLEFQRQYCYLSRVDFENDLAEVLCTKDEKKEYAALKAIEIDVE